MTSPDTHHHFARACRRSHWPPTHPSSPRCGDGRWLRRQHQHGVVAIEFALLFLFGVLPLLLLTFAGVMIFAAKQSLELAAANGARAALQYQNTDDARLARATSVAYKSMAWLFTFNKQTEPGDACTTSAPGAWICSKPDDTCAAEAPVKCITVTTYYDYDKHPLLPGTEWLIGSNLQSSATIQLSAGTP